MHNRTLDNEQKETNRQLGLIRNKHFQIVRQSRMKSESSFLSVEVVPVLDDERMGVDLSPSSQRTKARKKGLELSE